MTSRLEALKAANPEWCWDDDAPFLPRIGQSGAINQLLAQRKLLITALEEAEKENRKWEDDWTQLRDAANGESCQSAKAIVEWGKERKSLRAQLAEAEEKLRQASELKARAHEAFSRESDENAVLRGQLAETQKPCEWTCNEHGYWSSACGKASPVCKENFCPGCGHPVQVKEKEEK